MDTLTDSDELSSEIESFDEDDDEIVSINENEDETMSVGEDEDMEILFESDSTEENFVSNDECDSTDSNDVTDSTYSNDFSQMVLDPDDEEGEVVDEVVEDEEDEDGSIDFESDDVMKAFSTILEDFFINLLTSGATRDALNQTYSSLINLFNCIEILVTSKLTEENVGNIGFVFSSFKSVLQKFSTDYKRKKVAKANSFYVDPVAINFGTVTKNVRKSNRTYILQKPLLLYIIPVDKTLKVLFQSECFRKEYFNVNHTCTPGIFKGVCCGSVYQSGPLRRKKPLVIQLYNDTVNLADPCKQNCIMYRVGAIYYRVLNISPEFQSLDKNMHLCALYNENDVKEANDGLNSIIKIVISMFKELEEKGIEVEVMGEVTKLEVAVCSCAADNLGCHQLLGM